jgi:Lysyl oxidase
VVAKQAMTFCPDSYDPERASPDSPQTSPYPTQCGSFDPFPKGEVWGITRGWGVDPAETAQQPLQLKLALGTYRVRVTITGRYQRLLHIPPKRATATVTVTVVKGSGCCGAGPAVRSRQGAALAGPAVRSRQGAALAGLPRARTLPAPPMSARPDLVALPSWGITVSHVRKTGQDLLNFGATVWIGGNSPLDVQGFRTGGSPIMQAYQYFWRGGRVIGRVRAGTMGFDQRHGHNHWHFEQFAAYRLLDKAKNLAVASHKQGFCIAPTDGVDLTAPHAVWQPSFIGLSGQCGLPTALWVRETLPVGWGDTYFQSVAGQSFDIARVPNGTYYIEVVANPEHVLKETTTRNDTSLREVILGGTPGHRTVRVPAWHGIDPEN